MDGWDQLENFFTDFPNFLFTMIMQLLYFLVSCCYTLLDLAQLMFRLIAGLDTYALAGETVAGETISSGVQLGGSGDIFYQIIRKTFIIGDDTYSVIAIAFWSLIILSCLLLFITTIAAMIKSEVDTGKDGKVDNSKGKIIVNAIKALIYFVMVPIACYFGIWLGNVMLFVIDGATAPQTTSIASIDSNVSQGLVQSENGSYNYFMFWGQEAGTTYTSVSGLVNKVCLYQSSRIRTNTAFYDGIVNNTDPSGATQDPVQEGATYNFGIITQSTQEQAATLVDDLFMINAKLKTPQVLGNYEYNSVYGNASGTTVVHFDRSNIALVSYFYDLKQYNIILALLFIFTGGKVLLTLSFATMHRIIMLLAMMFAEPITLSFMPLDKGDAFGKWRKSFISHVLSLYVLVLVVNIFYIISPIFQTFTFFSTGLNGLSWADMVVQTAFIIASLMAIQSFEKLFSSFMGGESIMEAGAKTMEGLTNATKTLGGVAMGAFHLGTHAVGMGTHAVGALAHLGIAAGLAGAAAKDKRKEKKGSKRMAGVQERADRTDAQLKNDARARTLSGIGQKAAGEYRDYQSMASNREYQKYQDAGGKMSFADWQDKTGAGSYLDAIYQTGGSADKMRDYYAQYHGDIDGNFDEKAFTDWLGGGITGADEMAIRVGGGTAGHASRDTMSNFAGLTEEEYAKSAVDSATSDIDNKNENSSAYQSYKKDLQSAMQDRENARHDYEAYRQENERTHERRLRRAESAKKHAKYTWKSLGQVKNSATGVVTSVGGIASSGKKK